MPLRDPGLLHQVVIEVQENHLSVSCNCRGTVNPQAFKPHYEPIICARSISAEETKEAYNDPANHWKPFDASWRLTYGDHR